MTNQEAETILRAHETREACQYCGSRHVLSYGGKTYCRGPAHFAHGFEWSTPMEPMGKDEAEELLREIRAAKDATYPGGYEQWCDDRNIPRSKR